MKEKFNEWKQRIQQTGGDPEGGFLFKHVVLTEEEVTLVEQQELPFYELAFTLGVDFISKQCNGTITCLHLSSSDNEESIEENGIQLSESSFVYDLGKGVYAALKEGTEGIEAIENLKDYICEESMDEVLVVTLSYTGDYLQCIYGTGHAGYVVFPTSIPSESIDDLEVVTMDEFLLEW